MRAREVTVTDSPTLIANGGARINPDDVVILVPSGGSTVFVGDADVTDSSGFPLVAGSSLEWGLTGESIYGVVASGTQVVNVAERGD